MTRENELLAYVLFPWEAHVSHPDGRLAVAADLQPSSLRVDVRRSHTHDIRIPPLVSDHQYLQPHVW